MLFKCLFMLTFLVLSVSEAEGRTTTPQSTTQSTAKSTPECFEDSNVPYIKCTAESASRPSVCDCGNETECYIKLTITRNPGITGRGDKGNVFSVNGGRIGPTIIINQEQILAVDVINNIDKDTSIHWHGMHQKNMPWMDGVGMVTQWPIPANGGKFRYILRAHPSGTHWYHSHMETQRDEGIFGPLIVKEKNGVIDKLFTYQSVGEKSGYEDKPEKHMLAITEHIKLDFASKRKRACSPDGSSVPVKGEYVSSYQINGVKLHQTIHRDEQEPSFTVDGGKSYRFRVIGAMEETVTRVSIDGHKLVVVATDGFLTEPFEIDILHVHVGERYDFILKARDDVAAGTVFPIRIESVEVYCDNHDQPSRVGIAYLKYTAPVQVSDCTKDCVALNCPFAHYPVVEGLENATDYKCFDVYDALSLLHRTPEDELPYDTYPPPTTTKFFNHAFRPFKAGIAFSARINDIRFNFPTTPFAMSGNNSVEGECPYNTTKNCSRPCPHAVYIHERYKSKSIEFVLSSIPSKAEKNRITNLVTHPIHLHGHSFWVTKIAYPEYSSNGKIERVNDDVTVPSCGYGNWKDGIRPPGIRVDQYTIRKDVIIVPAGGYVVIEFMAENPGWWFMHCHIDHHLEAGMAVVVGEVPECQNPPPPELMKRATTNEFCISVDEFKRREKIDVCQGNNRITADEELPSELEKVEFEDFNSFNHRDDNDELAYRKLKKSLYYEEEQQHPKAILRGFQNERGGPFDGESKEWYKKK